MVIVVLLVGGGLVFVFTRPGSRPLVGNNDGDESPVAGGTLRIGLVAPETLDPARADRGLQPDLLVADLLFDGLTAYDPETLEPVPAVAARFAPNRARTVWRFDLRPGARFHSGRAIAGADVKYTLERIAKRGDRSAASQQLALIKGYRQFAIDHSAKGLAGVAVKGRRVTITLTEPMATLPSLLASPPYGIVPRRAARDATTFAREPVGSGPFALGERTATEARLERVAGAPGYVQGITLRFFAAIDEPYAAFQRDEVDVAVVPQELAQAAGEEYGTDGYFAYGAELFYLFNLDRDVFAKRDFREAIVRAIDREAIVREIYRGAVTRLDTVVPAGVPGAGTATCKACGYDPGRARALLDKAFPDGDVPRVTIDYDKGSHQDAIVRRIQADLGEVGIRVKLHPLADSAKAGDGYLGFLATGKRQLFRLGWVGSYPSADAYLNPLFVTDAPDNLAGFHDTKVDRLLEKARRTLDPDARTALFAQAEQRILDQLPLVPIAQFRTHFVLADAVHDFAVSVVGTLDASRVWVERAA